MKSLCHHQKIPFFFSIALLQKKWNDCICFHIMALHSLIELDKCSSVFPVMRATHEMESPQSSQYHRICVQLCILTIGDAERQSQKTNLKIT